jgi:hypothetical protein
MDEDEVGVGRPGDRCAGGRSGAAGAGLSKGVHLRGTKHFYVYGGPQVGTLVRVKNRETTYSKVERWPPQTIPYRYVLVSAPDGGSAFVPEDDQCLRLAFLSASGEPGDRETETLATEIQRRGLDI